MKLQNAEKAAIFGLPAKDISDDEAQKILVAQGFTPAQAKAHLDDAITAGAFVRDNVKVTQVADGAYAPEARKKSE